MRGVYFDKGVLKYQARSSETDLFERNTSEEDGGERGER